MCQCVDQAQHILVSHDVVPLLHNHNVHTWHIVIFTHMWGEVCHLCIYYMHACKYELSVLVPTTPQT